VVLDSSKKVTTGKMQGNMTNWTGRSNRPLEWRTGERGGRGREREGRETDRQTEKLECESWHYLHKKLLAQLKDNIGNETHSEQWTLDKTCI